MNDNNAIAYIRSTIRALKKKEREACSAVTQMLKENPRFRDIKPHFGPTGIKYECGVSFTVRLCHGDVACTYLNGKVSQVYYIRSFSAYDECQMVAFARDAEKDMNSYLSLFKQEYIDTLNSYYTLLSDLVERIRKAVFVLVETGVIKTRKRLDTVYVKLNSPDVDDLVGKQKYSQKFEASGELNDLLDQLFVNLFYIRTCPLWMKEEDADA